MKFKKTKLKSLLGFLFIIVISSCSKSESPSAGTTGTCSWSCDIDGVPYSWSGAYPPPSNRQDGATYIQAGNSNAVISLSGGDFSIYQILIVNFGPNPAPGNHNFNSSTFPENNVTMSIDGLKVFSSAMDGSNFNITIPSIPKGSWGNTGDFSGFGYSKGTFSGTLVGNLVDGTETSIKITNGKFEVMVLSND